MKNNPATVVAALSLFCSSASWAEPEVTPYRPSVASSTVVSAPGHFELEGGVQKINYKNDSGQFNVPWLLKYGVNDRFGVSVGGDAFLSVDDGAGNKISGVGNSLVSVRLLHPLNDANILGIEATVTLPTAKDSLGSGKSDYIINGLYGVDMGNFHADLNLSYVRLGIDDGDGQNFNGWAAAVSHPLGEKGGLTLEVSGVKYHSAPNTTQFLVAYAHTVSRRLAVDIGAARGLNDNPLKGSVFTGFTFLLDR